MIWSVEKSRELYRIRNWSDGYVDIDEGGNLCVRPDRSQSVKLIDVIKQLQQKGIRLPILLRFSNILQDRVVQLIDAFHYAMERNHYQGRFIAAYPIKVNQQRRVIEDIVAAGHGHVGLEAGSKPELLINIALAEPNSVLICNGYKDREYIELALVATQLKFETYIVIEKLSEILLLIDCVTQFPCRPELGIRVRLASIANGNWQNTGGEKSKFGLHANQILEAIKLLEEHGLADCLQLLHFHIGSQVPELADLQAGIREGIRYYITLKQQGVPLSMVDVGGGLGVDYEGTSSNQMYSMNYTMTDYAQTIVKTIYDICQHEAIALPDIITESGRAMTAHHAMMVTNIIDAEQAISIEEADIVSHTSSSILTEFAELLASLSGENAKQVYQDNIALFERARSSFASGELELHDWAQTQKLYFSICYRLNDLLDNDREYGKRLQEKLADKYFANFSVFQTLPDAWAIDQVFPIMPLGRLQEEPSRRCVLQDLTCDSDGRINTYINCDGSSHTLPIHEIQQGDPYLIGLFLLGAYQEILGDIHNLFGDSASINVEITPDAGIVFSEFDHGDKVSDLFQTIHIDATRLQQRYRQLISTMIINSKYQRACWQRLSNGLDGYTYLED